MESFILYPALLSIALIVYRLVYNYLRLRTIPGPFLAGTSNLWRAHYQWRGKLRSKLIQLHEVYGPIVRYSVDAVSICDSEVVPKIYVGKGFTIADSYHVLLGIKDGKQIESLVTVRDEAKHGAFRRSIANAFTPTAVLEMEPLIDPTIDILLDVLESKVEVDISRQMLWYSLDNAGQLLFSEDVGCLRTDSDVQSAGKMIHSRFVHWGFWSALPALENLIFRNYFALRMPRGQPAEFSSKAAQRFLNRRIVGSSSLSPDLLQKFIEANEKHPEVLDAQASIGMLMSTISGAADTTATTLVGILYFLITNSACRMKLERELLSAQVTLPVPKYAETRHLPYLDAVVKESMRLFSTPTWPMERCVPTGGMQFKEFFVPEGTSVGVLPAALHMDRSIFGEDIKSFRPERWLEGDAERTRKMEASFLGFSRGKRACLGQNIAVLQLKKVIPALVMKFDMKLANEHQILDGDYSPAVAMVSPLHLKLTTKR